MKDKIIMLVLGILIGAVITGGAFLIINQNKSGGPMMERGEMPDGQQFEQDGNSTRPGRRLEQDNTTNDINNTEENTVTE